MAADARGEADVLERHTRPRHRTPVAEQPGRLAAETGRGAETPLAARRETFHLRVVVEVVDEDEVEVAVVVVDVPVVVVVAGGAVVDVESPLRSEGLSGGTPRYWSEKRAICSRSTCHCRFAASAVTEKRSGCRSITSSVEAPMEPVAPRIVILRAGAFMRARRTATARRSAA